MKRDTIMTKPLKSSFLSCEKDAATIIKKLFVESRPYSDILKKLLIINTKDCINENSININKYQEIIKRNNNITFYVFMFLHFNFWN